MKDRRKYALLGFFVWWTLIGALMTGIPFRIGTATMYPPEKGLGTIPYKDLNIANLQRENYNDFASFAFGGHPKRGPYGTTFDMVNYRKSGGPFANASWNTMAFGSGDFIRKFYGPVNPHKVKLPGNEQVTQYLKELAKQLGAAAVGIADLGPDPLKWLMSTDWTGRPLHFKPEENRYAIVAVHIEELADHPFSKDMSRSTLRYYTKVSQNYFYDDYIAGQLASYIRSLGYNAIGHNNGYVRSIPVAMLAGLGEVGRNGLLLTEKWGPNVRINTVTTDIPLIPDKPVDIGIQSVCGMCSKCYDYCPGRAVAAEKAYGYGALKWNVNNWRCRQAIQIGMDKDIDASTCTLCRDVCPFSKSEEFSANRMGRWMVSRSWVARKVLVKLDDWLYSKWNKHDLKELITERRARFKESQKVGYVDKSDLWMTQGLSSEEARHKYATEIYPGGWKGGAGGAAFGDLFPLYAEADMKRPEFGKWPTWYDIWGRKIPGYQDGEKGAPGLDFAAVEKVVPTVALSGYGPIVPPGDPIVSQRYHAYGLLDPMTPGY
jgi:epoxyqueuosine reductase